MTKVKQLEKMNEIVKDIRTCMFATVTEQGEMRARPMSTAQLDDKGDIWFFTDEDSAKVKELAHQQPILLTYADTDDNTYLSVTGRAYEVEDLSKKKELFNTFTKAWYPDGPESPNLSLIKVVPETAEYWDSSDSNLVQLWKIGSAVIRGERYQSADDEHATINIS